MFTKIDNFINRCINKVAGIIATYIEARRNGNSRRISLLLAAHDGEWSEPIAISAEEAAEALKGAICAEGFDLAEIIDTAKARRISIDEIDEA